MTPLYVDNSLLSTVGCSTAVALRHIYGYTSLDENAAMKAGSSAHKALATWFTGSDKLAALADFEKDYRDFADANVAPDDRLSYSNTSTILDNWFDTKGKDLIKDVEVIPGFVEVGFAYPLSSGQSTDVEFIFCGRFDMLVRWHGQLYVWENKTTGRIDAWFKGRLRLGSQLAGYLWAAKKIMAGFGKFKEINISGVLVNGIQFKVIPSSDKKCSQHGTKYSECGLFHLEHAFLGPYGRSPEDLVEWEKTAVNLAKRYKQILSTHSDIKYLRSLRTQGKFFGACPNCFSKDFCMAGRPLDKVDSMLSYDPWSPFDDVVQESQNMYLDEILKAKEGQKHGKGN